MFAAGVALLVVNSLTPHLGLKTESSFTMFSNLRTERGSWNHLFIPESVRVFSYQDHLVRIAASNDPALRASAASGTQLVLYEVQRRLRSHTRAARPPTPREHPDLTSPSPPIPNPASPG